MSVKITIRVSDIEAALALYDRILVERSSEGADGPWEAATGPTRTAASVTGTEVGPFDLNGTTLEFHLNHGTLRAAELEGDDLNINEVVEQVNSTVDGIASESSGALQLRSLVTGSQSSIVVASSGDAAPLLGLVDARSVGLDQHIRLQEGVSIYKYSDGDGSPTHWYRIAFYNTESEAVSDYETPFPASSVPLLAEEYLSVGSLDLATPDGLPVVGLKVSFYPMTQPLEVGGIQVGIFRDPVVVETDARGHAEVSLVRGIQVRVAFQGTSLVRTIVVPDEDTFNINTALSGSADPFSVVTPAYPAAPRRTT